MWSSSFHWGKIKSWIDAPRNWEISRNGLRLCIAFCATRNCLVLDEPLAFLFSSFSDLLSLHIDPSSAIDLCRAVQFFSINVREFIHDRIKILYWIIRSFCLAKRIWLISSFLYLLFTVVHAASVAVESGGSLSCCVPSFGDREQWTSSVSHESLHQRCRVAEDKSRRSVVEAGAGEVGV